MKLIRTLQKNKEFSIGSVAAIGNFDGVHRGHQMLLAALREQATHLQLPMVVILFEPQPREFFQKREAPPRLTRLREKVHVLRDCGVDYVYCLRFNEQLAHRSPVEFAEHVIFLNLNVKYLLVGDDFRFGRNRQGDVALLKQLAQKSGCVVDKCPDFLMEEERVSSTQVRQALQLGEFERVTSLLGRLYSTCGRVMYGDARGRQWGVPTANLKMTQAALPLKGVFCVRVQREGYPLLSGVANVGQRPTIDGTKQVLEVHLFDVNESLYGERLQVFFLHKLRDEVKFPSLDALIAQIHLDLLSAKAYFLE
ncbi:MAG: bifunctional riboflavin kinase/FAD synthetase [Legionellaceae bacterium]|nr:bifunctional riboflavin kinase/FAD synthetase [Legionellaceae bacterium]